MIEGSLSLPAPGGTGAGPTPVLLAEGLTKRFGDLVAVGGVGLEVRRGEVLALLGPNGAGKTTTLRMLAGLLRPDQGRTLVDGRLLELGSPESRRIGVCPQRIIVWERLTCLEQLTFMGAMYGVARAAAHRRARSLLADLGLSEKSGAQARLLSGGMQRRLNLALALVHDPDILFLDEPQAGLDPQSRVLVRDYLRRLSGTRAIVLTTHDMDEADRLASRVAIIDHGVILAEGTQAGLKRRLVDAEVLEVDLAEAPSDPLRQRLLQQAQAGGGEATLVERTLAVRCGNAAARVSPLLQALREAGVAIGDVRLRQPTLEDVFLALTGRRLRE